MRVDDLCERDRRAIRTSLEKRSILALLLLILGGGRGCNSRRCGLMMQLGVDGSFVGSGIFKSGDPARRAAAIVKSVTHFQDAGILAEVSKDLGEPMVDAMFHKCLKQKKWHNAGGKFIVGAQRNLKGFANDCPLCPYRIEHEIGILALQGDSLNISRCSNA